MFKISNHLLEKAEFIESPNFSERPNNYDLSLLVFHNISLPPGEFGGSHIKDFFTNTLDLSASTYFQGLKEEKVSSHLLIDRKGHLIQFVPFNKSAWHAGVSSFEGRENCNDFSIGIEIEGTDDIPYTDAQYLTLQSVSKCLIKAFPKILLDNIVGHSDISPNRKTDPGKSFDWKRFRESLV